MLISSQPALVGSLAALPVGAFVSVLRAVGQAFARCRILNFAIVVSVMALPRRCEVSGTNMVARIWEHSGYPASFFEVVAAGTWRAHLCCEASHFRAPDTQGVRQLFASNEPHGQRYNSCEQPMQDAASSERKPSSSRRASCRLPRVHRSVEPRPHPSVKTFFDRIGGRHKKSLRQSGASEVAQQPPQPT